MTRFHPGGPRLCLGERFSLLVVRFAAVKLLSRYRLVATDSTRLDAAKGSLFLFSIDRMNIRLERRTAD